jgi:dihydroorotate dehydrogenase (NAD+) catalytic subunit
VVCGVKLKNPLILASGILGGTASILVRMATGSGAGALITKSIGLKPRTGYRGPTVIKPFPNVVLNAMGLPNPGYLEFIKIYEDLRSINIPIIPSIFGETPEEFGTIAKAFEDAGAPLIELNVSCPHSVERYNRRRIIAQDPVLTASVVAEVKREVNTPIIVKLSPNVTDIAEIAVNAVKAGADALSGVNTFHAIEIEPYLERPVLGNIVGGQSGGAIRPMAQYKILDIILGLKRAKASGIIQREVPVIGMGGVQSGEDAARFILLGCTCVGIGSAAIDNINIFNIIKDELIAYMRDMGYENIDAFRGKVLSWLSYERAY